LERGIVGSSITNYRKEHGVMDVSRRGFLQISGTALMASGLGISLKPVAAHAQPLKIKYARETTTICPYCAVGCGIIVSTRNGKVINTEGDPDHPVNKGSLCTKGGSIYQLSVNKNRMDKVLYRAPYATGWKQVSWEWAIDRIARNVKESRDKSFEKRNRKGQVVNRTEGIASVGSAAMDNEECFIYQKFLRGLGLVYIEHQARI
jgi:formate dehydrogenase major subunit